MRRLLYPIQHAFTIATFCAVGLVACDSDEGGPGPGDAGSGASPGSGGAPGTEGGASGSGGALPDGFDWEKWAAVLNEDPCTWLDASVVAEIIGSEVEGVRDDNSQALSCLWRTADFETLLRANVMLWGSAEAAVHERQAIEEAIEILDDDFFEIVDAPGGVVSAYFRKDRNELSLFARSDAEDVSIAITSSTAAGEGPETFEERAARVRAYGRALIEAYGF